MNGFYYFIDLMQKGKTVNYIISVLYVLALAAAAERLVYYIATRYKRAVLNTVLKECRILYSRGLQIGEDVLNRKELEKSYMPMLAETFFEYRSAESSVLTEALERTVQRIIAAQERGFVLLSRIAAVAPLLGLLGTVTGLMTAFQKIAALGGSVDIAILSGGIWEAMITTATGLITAIFSFAVYEIFDWLNMRRVRDMEQTVSVLTEGCRVGHVPPADKGSGNEAL